MKISIIQVGFSGMYYYYGFFFFLIFFSNFILLFLHILACVYIIWATALPSPQYFSFLRQGIAHSPGRPQTHHLPASTFKVLISQT
jgi:hypothetical protein